MAKQITVISIVTLLILACEQGMIVVAPVASTPTAIITETITPTEVSGDTYYVSSVGDDANPGSFEAPWLTMKKAVDTVTAGDIVYVLGGEYLSEKNGWIFANSGTQSKPITITNYPGEQVIFRIAEATRNDFNVFGCSINPNAPASWQTTKADYVRIIGTNVMPRLLSNGVQSEKGIVFQGEVGEQSAGIIVSDCDHWEVAGVDFIDTAYGIFTQKNNWHLPEEHSTDYWYVHDNRVYNFYRESGMQFNGNYNRIENNEIYKVSDQLDTPHGCQMLNLLGNNNVVIGNTLSRMGSAAKCTGILLEWDLADANLIKNNLIRDVYIGIAIQGGDNNIIQNNQIIAIDSNWRGVWIASYDNRISWPCNDYIGSGNSAEAILPPDDPTHPDYPYYFNPRNCHSMGNQIIDNTILGFSDSLVMVPVIEKSNIYLDNIISEP